MYSDSSCSASSLVGQLTTGSNGYSNTLSLQAGTYYVKERNAPRYYALSTEVKTVTISSGQTSTVTFSNAPLYGIIQINKYSTDSTYNESLAGAVFGIYNSSGTLVQSVTTNSSGVATSAALPCGNYTVRETSALSGYELNTRTYSVSILNYTTSVTNNIYVQFFYNGELYFQYQNASAYSGRTDMRAAVWTEVNGQDDIEWCNLTEISGNIFYGRVYMGVHPGTGSTQIHIYAGGTFVGNRSYNVSGYSPNISVSVSVPEEPRIIMGYIELQKASSNTSISNSNSSYSLQNAVYGVYSDSGCTNQVTTLTTNASGYAKSGELKAGTYYVKEITAPSGYMVDTKVYTVTVTGGQTTRVNGSTVSDAPIYTYFSILKSSENTTVTDNSDAYKLNGAEYTLYRGSSWNSTSTLGTYTTDSNGRITTGALPVLTSGNYYFIKETKPSAGYVLNNTIYRIAVTAGTNGFNYTVWQSTNNGSSWSQTASSFQGTNGAAININSEEPPKTFDIQLAKVSENSSLSDGNSCYSYEGAVYTLYWEQMDDSHVAARYTTDSNGNFTASDVPIRSSGSCYYLKETTASPGFMLDETIWRIKTTDSAGTDNFSYTLDYSKDGGVSWISAVGSTTVDSSTTIKITSEEPPANDPVGITITKIDDPGQENPLKEYWQDKSGAQFTINFYDGQYDSVSDLPDTPTRSWVIETKYSEVANEYRTVLDEEHFVSGDEFYYDLNGSIVLPLGTITVEETKPAFGYTTEGGYLVDGTGAEVSSEDGVILLNITQNGISGGDGRIEAGNYYTKEEYHRYCSITLHKKGDDGQAIEGATFALQIQNEDGGWDDVEVGTSDANGDVVFDELVFGTYKITETSTNNGYTLLKDPIIVELPYSSEDGYADTDPTFSQDGYDYYCDVSYTVTNTPTFDIPMTGVSGISIFPVIGASILAAAIGMIFYSRKRKRYV